MEPTNSSNGSRSPEVSEKAQRRRFTGEYKRSIVDQYDGLGRGEQGALLRREGLYSSHIDAWRKQREAGVLSGLATKRRGPKPKAQPAVDRENAELRRKVARLERKLKQAETIIEIQKSWAGPEGSGGLRRRRERLMAAVDAHRELVGVKPLCDALAVSRETYYRRTRPAKTHPARPRSRPPRALSDSERAEVLELLCSERFVDRSPVEMYATLLDEGIYHCSLRTMYRVLKASHAVRERRDQLRHPNYKKPELIATAPNQVWSWE